MLVVPGRKETDPPPPVYGVQGMGTPDQEVVEGHREGPGVETFQSPFGQVVVEGDLEKSTGAVLDFLGSTRVGCIRARSRAGGGGQGGFG